MIGYNFFRHLLSSVAYLGEQLHTVDRHGFNRLGAEMKRLENWMAAK